MILKRSAMVLGKWIYDSIDEEQKEKIKNEKGIELVQIQNRLKVLILYIAVLITLISVAYIYNIWIEMLISVTSLAVIRWWNGGHHFNVDLCYLVTNGVIIGTIPLTHMLSDYSYIILIVSLLINALLAPFNSHKNCTMRKIISITLGIIAFFIDDICLTMYFILSIDLIKLKRGKNYAGILV